MLYGGGDRFRDTIASALGWWAEAGLDTAISENPRDWLAPPARSCPEAQPLPTSANSATAAIAVPSTALPDNLAALHALLATGEYMPTAAPPRQRVAAAGDPGADLMIVTDMPDPGDVEAGHLFAGATARLFDAILAALGRNRDNIYYAPLSPARIAGGRVDPHTATHLTALMRHHVALAKPRAAILFGDETCRALLGIERSSARGDLRSLNHDGGIISVIAAAHPRFMLRHPACKAEAWADMRRLSGVFGS